MAFYRDIKYRASDTADIKTLDNITFDGSSSYSLTRDSAAFTPSGASNILLSIDGVVQSGNFTITGSTIDFGVNVPATSVCDFILHLGVGVINTPADGSVTEAKIANGAVSLDKLSATGTKDSTTFLRGDNTFSTVSPSMYPAFEAYLSADQSVSDSVFAKVAVDTEVFDTDNCYDNTTNYRFTPTVAGKYFVQGKTFILSSTTSNLVSSISEIRKNGSSYIRHQTDYGTSRTSNDTISVHGIIEMNGTTDYLELWGRNNVASGGSPVFYGTNANDYRWTGWGAYRIGA